MQKLSPVLQEAPAIALPVGRYRVFFRPCSPPAASGTVSLSAWRGAFGHALKRAVCVTRAPQCTGCLLLLTCSYPYLFETPPPDGAQKMRRYRAAPHPYLFSGWSEDPELFTLELTLIGRGNQYLPYALHALDRAGAEGIGSNRKRFQLESVAQEVALGSEDWQPIYHPQESCSPLALSTPLPPPAPPGIGVRLLSPLRLKHEEHLVDPGSFRFADLFGNLLRRISMLTYFHTDTPLETDFAHLMALAHAVSIAGAELTWQDWTRYSSRQHTTMEMGGLMGTFRVAATDLAPFWPYLWLGQWVHAGKAAVMGNGRYRLEPAASLPDRTAALP